MSLRKIKVRLHINKFILLTLYVYVCAGTPFHWPALLYAPPLSYWRVYETNVHNGTWQKKVTFHLWNTLWGTSYDWFIQINSLDVEIIWNYPDWQLDKNLLIGFFHKIIFVAYFILYSKYYIFFIQRQWPWGKWWNHHNNCC